MSVLGSGVRRYRRAAVSAAVLLLPELTLVQSVTGAMAGTVVDSQAVTGSSPFKEAAC